MNAAQWQGERLLRADPTWSPLADGLADVPALLDAAARGPQFPLFSCGHPKSPENSMEFLAHGKYTVHRCRECGRRNSALYAEKRRAKRAELGIGRGQLASLWRVVALSMLPCSASELARAVRCGRESARSVLHELVADSLAVAPPRQLKPNLKVIFERAPGVAPPDDVAVDRARRLLLLRGSRADK